MSLKPTEQLKEAVAKAKSALILIPTDPSGDSLGSAMALYHFLTRRGVNSEIAHEGAVDWGRYKFLNPGAAIKKEISGARDFILSFSTTHNRIIKVKTKETGSEFHIVITPERGAVDPRDFSFVPARFKYDLLFVLSAPDLASLGKLYEENSDLFFEVPVVNIDNKTENENFGKINIVDVTASSTSEIIYRFLEEVGELDQLDKEISNALLTGIISATNSFQQKNTTPRTFLAAASLIDRGAQQQEIVRWMYKTQPLAILKLWGRVMARLNWDAELKLVWSLVSIEDFVQSRAKINDLAKILDKVKENYDIADLLMVLYNKTADKVTGLLKFKNKELLEQYRHFISGEVAGDILSFGVEGSTVIEAEKAMLEKLRKIKTEGK